jgi:hypothetical protein
MDDDDDEGFFMNDFFTKDLDIEATYSYSYTHGSDEKVELGIRGIAREYGQTTLGTGDGTGLTIWRGAEELARYLWSIKDVIAGKKCLELGAGLGLVGLLTVEPGSNYDILVHISFIAVRRFVVRHIYRRC